MAKKPPFRALLLAPRNGGHTMALECARIVSRSRDGQCEAVFNQSPRAPSKSPLAQAWFEPEFKHFLETAEQRVGQSSPPIRLLIVDWFDDPLQLQEILNLMVRRQLPGIVVNWPARQPVEGILFASGGGLHTVSQIRVVGELAKAMGLPIRMLRIIPPADATPAAANEAEEELAKTTRLQLRMLGLKDVPIETGVNNDVVAGLRALARPGELMVIGGPNYGRTLAHFQNSIPDILIRDRAHPSLMVLAGKSAADFSLKSVFWEETIRIDLPPSNRRDLIGQLVDTLIVQRQLPAEWREFVMGKAMLRESVQPTSVGCETAFPHVAIPGFSGVTGCFGVCPQGVDFGDPENPVVRFVFLVITPQEDYDDYLTVLAALARRMIRPEIRQRLLACRSAAEVQAILTREPTAHPEPAPSL